MSSAARTWHQLEVGHFLDQNERFLGLIVDKNRLAWSHVKTVHSFKISLINLNNVKWKGILLCGTSSTTKFLPTCWIWHCSGIVRVSKLKVNRVTLIIPVSQIIYWIIVEDIHLDISSSSLLEVDIVSCIWDASPNSDISLKPQSILTLPALELPFTLLPIPLSEV